MAISKYLDESLVVFLDEDRRDEVLDKLVDAAEKRGMLASKGSFYQAILQREKIVSTGIGMGVAIPHAKFEGDGNFFIVIGIQHKRGIDWNALDGVPVRLIFMIGGPENKQTEYLKILSDLTIAIKDEEKRKKLIKATTAQEAIGLFEGC